MKISDVGVLGAMRALLPWFATAGRVACRVQDDIRRNGKHNGDAKTGDRFTEIVTDADIIVETFLGTAILDAFEDAAFYGEEHERDRVSGYFPKDAPYLVTLDPIDGTLYFADGLPLFGIILTVCAGDRIVGALIALPREERFYLATEADGAFTTTVRDVADGAPLSPFRTAAREPVVILGNGDLALEPALKEAGFVTVNPNRDYDRSAGWQRTSIRMFTGEVAGMIVTNAQVIDAAAIAFIAAAAGGAVNGVRFDPSTMRVARLVAATGRDAYDKLMGIAGA